MKLLSTQEVKDRKQAEIARDIGKTENVKKALDKVTTQLNDAEARFNIALAGQRVRWANEEKEYLERLDGIKKEIKSAEDHLSQLLKKADGVLS